LSRIPVSSDERNVIVDMTTGCWCKSTEFDMDGI
jgi:hypothetical protein